MKNRSPLIWLVTSVAIATACGGSSSTSTTALPPASAEEIRVFCERYEEVQDLSYEEKFGALIEVAPAEIRGSLIRMVNNPGPTEDDFRVDDFLDHCTDR